MKLSRNEAQSLLERQAAAVDWQTEDTRAVLRHMREEKRPVKRRALWAAALALSMLLGGIALAASLPGILDSLERSVGNVAAPEAENMVTAIGAAQETKHVTFTVTEALYDGYGAYIMVKAEPRDAHTLLLPETYELSERAGALIDALSEDRTTTLADYARAQGYTTTVSVSAWPREGGECAVVDHWQDNTLYIGVMLPASGDELKLYMECAAAAYLDERRLESRTADNSARIPVALSSLPVLWTASMAEPVDYPELGLRVEALTMTGTALSTYVTMRSTVTDTERYQEASVCLLDEEGSELERGMVWPGRGTLRKPVNFWRAYSARSQAMERVLLRFVPADESAAPVERMIELK